MHTASAVEPRVSSAPLISFGNLMQSQLSKWSYFDYFDYLSYYLFFIGTCQYFTLPHMSYQTPVDSNVTFCDFL
jgi:hypothetical protein